VQETHRTLRQWREAIQNNQIAFPSPVPIFRSQVRADIQWRVAELYLIRGWTCEQLAKRYGVTRGRMWRLVRTWLDRALTLGYLQDIPPAVTTVVAAAYAGISGEAAMPLFSQPPPALVVPQESAHI